MGTPVLIPEDYVADLSLRLGLYKRLADLSTTEEIDAFGAELIDRFGPLPEEVDHLLKIVFIIPLALIMAELMSQKIRGSGIFRVIYFMPTIISTARQYNITAFAAITTRNHDITAFTWIRNYYIPTLSRIWNNDITPCFIIRNQIISHLFKE